jgi:hypothetical protein
MTSVAPDPIEATASGANAAPTSASAVALSGQQRALLHALDERDRSLSAMYRGGIAVLGDAANPDRFAQCAHSMRELMEKLPELLDVPTTAQKERLKAKVREIEDAFLGVQRKTCCFSATAGWDGSIDGHLRKFLTRLGSFLEWFASHQPRRRDELHGVLVRLDGSGRELPKPLASLNVDTWGKKRDYFQSVSHHRRTADEQEFRQRLDALERFLLDRLEPRTFDDFAEIDDLLGEGGEHA